MTLHGIDRLTGMPVLLHRLDSFAVPTPLPDSAALLPVYEVDVWDGQPYAITELPLSATPATHPGAAALGALRALSALHAAGQVHGNVNAAQLWQVGREVRLAGAGLPWSREGSPAADLAALGQTLDSLGARPAALDGLETQSAAQALRSLEQALHGQRPAEAAPAQMPAQTSVQPSAPRQSPEPLRPEAARPVTPQPAHEAPATTQVTPAAPQPARAHTPTPPVPNVLPKPVQIGATQTGAVQIEPVQIEASRTDSPPVVSAQTEAALPESTPPAGAQPASSPAGNSRKKAQPSRKAARRQEQEARRAAAAAASTPVTPTVPAEAPPMQEVPAPAEPVSYRAADDIIVIGVPLEAATEAAPSQDASPPVRLIPAPIRIGFDDHSLPDWTPQDAGTGKEAQAGTDRRVPAVSPTLTASPTPTAPPVPADLPPAHTPGNQESGSQSDSPAVTSVRQQPLRIGWEEDHSWRVVKSGPESRRTQVSARANREGAVRTLPRPVVMALAALVVLGGLAFWWRGQTATSADSCCTQQFTVSGSRQPVKVTLVQAPPGSPLTPGGVVGTAPGLLKFPDTPGSYTLKFEAAGHGALTGVVTVPSDQAFDIVLK